MEYFLKISFPKWKIIFLVVKNNSISSNTTEIVSKKIKFEIFNFQHVDHIIQTLKFILIPSFPDMVRFQ